MSRVCHLTRDSNLGLDQDRGHESGEAGEPADLPISGHACAHVFLWELEARQGMCPPRDTLADPHSQLWGGLEPLFFMHEEAPCCLTSKPVLQPWSMCWGLTPRPTLRSRAVTTGWSDRTFLDALCHGKKGEVLRLLCSPQTLPLQQQKGGLGGERLPSLGRRGESFRSRNPW